MADARKRPFPAQALKCPAASSDWCRMKASIALLSAIAFLAVAAPAQASLSAETGGATAVLIHRATLHGTVDPSGSLPSYYFEYGPTVAYGAQTPAIPFVTKMKVEATITGLAAGTLYHYRLVAKRPLMAARGADMTFMTQPKDAAPDPDLGGTITDPVSGLPIANPLPDTTGGDPPNGTPVDPPDNGTSTDPVANPVTGGDDAVQPVIGETIGAAPSTGSILVRPPGEDTFRPLDDGAPIADGSTVDSREGSVNIVTAVGNEGAVQAATFRGAIFQVRQRRSAGGLTDITLRGGDFSSCRGPSGHVGQVVAARARRPVRRLWGRDHHGSFRTHGRGAIATVRGTTWVMADYCDGTRTRVLDGAVSVRDKRLHRAVLVRAGQSYFARTSR